MLKYIIFLLLLAFFFELQEGRTCTPNPSKATTLTSPISAPTVVQTQITFDNLGYSEDYGWISEWGFPATVFTQGGQTVNATGSGCRIVKNYFSVGIGTWYGDRLWNGENSYPGYFMALYSDTSGYCALTFSSPIVMLSMRTNTFDKPTRATMHIFDESDYEISCTTLVPTDGGDNSWTTFGFESSIPIKTVALYNTYAVLDIIDFFGCARGYIYNESKCFDVNECNDDPCDSLASCSNTNGAFTCSCPSGYSGDGIGHGGCQDINECDVNNNPCAVNALCSNTNGSFTCYCDDGYEGNGTTGCTLVPVSAPVVTPVAAPQPGKLLSSSAQISCFVLLKVFVIMLVFL